MRQPLANSFYLVFVVLLPITHGLRLPLSSRKTDHSYLNGAPHRRDVGSTAVPLVNVNNDHYVVNITLGGKPFTCTVDTGSSDLYVFGVVPGARDTGHTSNFSYGIGSVFGNLMEAPLTFASHSVPSQAFLSVTSSSGTQNDTGTGLIGLGPPIASVLVEQIQTISVEPPMSNIFAQNLTSDNYITLFLSRDDDPESTAISQLTVSEPLPGYESILQQSKLPVPLNLADEIKYGEAQYWKTYTDPNGVLGPDGQPISLKSKVHGAPDSALVVTFDSGDTLPQVLPELATAIYSTVPGAIWNDSLSIWTVPCTHELNLTVVFGGQKIYIHPFDLSAPGPAVGIPDLDPVNGVAMCCGLYQPIQPGGENPFFDMLFGLAFLRNVYILYDYGDRFIGNATDPVSMFIKMLSITDPVEAHNDFVNVRLNNNLNAPLNGQVKPVGALAGSKSRVSGSTEGPLTKRTWFYVVVCVIGALILFLGICVLVRRRRQGPGKDLMDRCGKWPFMFSRGDQNYRSMVAVVPLGIDEDDNPHGLAADMREKRASGEEVATLTQKNYEDPFADDVYKS
ncbi:hypothetical protein FRB96_007408 [Tulasnella sp. 330]|nr:hypothetical protein FRB96_007408 [Tulasnella sp. 330]KAG8877732.1 hypothetical protein FRB97_003146 [Tulasnella sp. 331]KAG8884405.1 hypothetical protein FRB98_002415 [Tulasnella sp. 332]